METRKKEFSAVRAMLAFAALAAALALTGCPGMEQGGTDITDPNTELEYSINFLNTLKDGNVNVPLTAKSGASVSAILLPNPGFEPVNLSITMSGNRTVEFTRSGADNNTITFTMPASPVTIAVEFHTFSKAVEAAYPKITPASTWGEIDALKALVEKMQKSNPTSADDKAALKAAIDHLVGTEDNTEIIKAAGDTRAVGARTEDETEKKTIGVIREKMRNEDLSTWFPLNYPTNPADRIDKGKDIEATDGTADKVGVDRSHIYYVKEVNPTIPTPSLKEGWKALASGPVPSTHKKHGLVEGLDGVIQVPLYYQVGDSAGVTYYVWLWPVAEYYLSFEQNASPSGVSVKLCYGGTRGEGERILNATRSEIIYNVGKPKTEGGGREITVTITAESANIALRVTDWAGTPIMDKDGNVLTSIVKKGDTETLGVSEMAKGEFYPASQRYKIIVRPRTPPTEM